MNISPHDDPLDDFARGVFSAFGKTRSVYRLGAGPAVVVLHEMPGLTPEVADFARRVAAAGFSVVVPHLFGLPGHTGRDVPNGVRMFVWACLSREFGAFDANRTPAILPWLRALAHWERERCGGPGVGAVGMCITGSMPLAMATEDAVVAPVLSQPSGPMAATPRLSRDIGLSPDDLARVQERCRSGDLNVLALRFSKDFMVPDARWRRLERELGPAMRGIDIDSSPGNEHGLPRYSHAVLTASFVDEPGHPTAAALDAVLDFFRERLLVTDGSRV